MPYEDEELARFEPDAELDRLTNAVIGAAIEVHRRTGPGLDEASYEAALAIELRLRNVPFQRQVVYQAAYKGEVIGERRMDFVIGGVSWLNSKQSKRSVRSTWRKCGRI